MLLLVPAAMAFSYAEWRGLVDRTIDDNLRSLRPCVAFSRAVDRDGYHVVSLALTIDEGGHATARRLDETMMETWISTCFAEKLAALRWPAPPVEVELRVALRIAGLEPQRVDSVSFAPPGPDEDASMVGLSRDLVQLPVSKQLRLGERCLKITVKVKNETTAGKMQLRFRLTDEGWLSLVEANGAEALPEMRECVIAELRKVRFPRGFGGTSEVRVAVEFEGEGGEWARADAATLAGARAYRWKYRYWLWLRRPSGAATEARESHWVYRTAHAVEGDLANAVGCVIAAGGGTGAYDLLAVAGPEGLAAVAVRPQQGPAGAASCIAESIQRVEGPGAGARFVVSGRVEVLPGGKALLAGLAPLRTDDPDWPAPALLSAAASGDRAGFLAALPANAAHTEEDEWAAGLPGMAAGTSSYSWWPGPGWPGYNRLVIGEQLDGAAVDAQLLPLGPLVGGCQRAMSGRRVQLVVELTAAADGTLRVNAPIYNPVDIAAYTCIRTALDGQRVSLGGKTFTAFYPVALMVP